MEDLLDELKSEKFFLIKRIDRIIKTKNDSQDTKIIQSKALGPLAFGRNPNKNKKKRKLRTKDYDDHEIDTSTTTQRFDYPINTDKVNFSLVSSGLTPDARKQEKEKELKRAAQWYYEKNIKGDHIFNNPSLHSLDFKLVSNPRKTDTKIALRLKAVLIPGPCPKFHPDISHQQHEFTELEQRSMVYLLDNKNVPALVDHAILQKVKPEAIYIGRVVEAWMMNGSLHVLIEIDEMPNYFEFYQAIGYIARGLTPSVSLTHNYYGFESGFSAKLPLEVSVCSVPRRKGADIYFIEYLCNLSSYVMDLEKPWYPNTKTIKK